MKQAVPSPAKFVTALKAAAPFLAFALGTWYFCLRILGYDLAYIPGDLGDSRFINYLLEHCYRWFSGDLESFWDGGFLYPFGNTLALSDTMLGTAPLYALWRFLGFSPETAYQLWWIGINALNYWVSYWIFKKWLQRADIAVVLAFIFSFTLFNLGQLNFMQMIIRFLVPVVFYAAYKMVTSPALKYLLVYALGIVFQFYCIIYTGFYLLYFSIFFILILYLAGRQWKAPLFYVQKKNLLRTGAIVVVAVAGMLWLFLPYLEMSKMTGMLRYNDVKANLPYPTSYIFPHLSSLTWRFLFDLGRPNVPDWWLQHLFIGIVPFTVLVVSPFYLLVATLKKIKIPTVVKALILTSVMVLAFHVRTYDGLSFYPWLMALPGVGSMRVLTRFMNVELFILLLILGYLLTKVKLKYVLILSIVVFADNLFIVKHLPREEKAEIIHRREVLLEEIQTYDYNNYKAVALHDTSLKAYRTNIDMMIVAQALGIKTVNGYSSYCPPALVDFTKLNRVDGLQKWLHLQGLKEEEILFIRHGIPADQTAEKPIH